MLQTHAVEVYSLSYLVVGSSGLKGRRACNVDCNRYHDVVCAWKICRRLMNSLDKRYTAVSVTKASPEFVMGHGLHVVLDHL